MKIQAGDLVKYKTAHPRVPAHAAPAAYYKFNWTGQQCVDNLIGLVTKVEGNKIFIHWFCLNQTIWEWKDYLKVVE